MSFNSNISNILNKKEKMEIIDFINHFKKEGIKILEKLNEEQLATIIREANKAYFHNNPIMTDNEYDIIKEYIEINYPKNNVLKEIGAPVMRNKVKLPYYMGSMSKIKPDTKALDEWIKKYHGPYVLSAKLDGISALFVNDNGKMSLYKRGDKVMAQDISYLIPFLQLPKTKDIVIRGELMILKEIFDMKYKKDCKGGARQMVAGLTNKKKIDERIKDIDFVAHELIKPEKNPFEQFKYLDSLDIKTVIHLNVKNISNELLSEILLDWRKNYIYDIDGVIVTDDKIYERKDKNPEHSFAFKMILSDQIAEAKVVDVIWTPSKDGYLKPRVKIEPIYLGGVKIEYATGFNASFIENNKIGIGALIKIIRSGDVIPDIQSVTIPADKAKMPDVPYKWTDTHVDIILLDHESDKTVIEKKISSFFEGIKVEGLGIGNVCRLIKSGFNTIPKILKMNLDDFLKVDGFKLKMAEKLYNGIKEKINEASLIDLMASSNIFGRGFGERKIKLIMDEYPDLLTSNKNKQEKIDMVSHIKGMADKTSIAFIEEIPDFIKFLEDCNLTEKLNIKIKKNSENDKKYNTTNPLFEKIIVMSKFRDKELIENLKNLGAIIGSNVTKNTFVLIVKDIDDTSSKISDAKNLNIPIIKLDDFLKKYF